MTRTDDSSTRIPAASPLYPDEAEPRPHDVRWTYQRDGDYLHCELRTRLAGCELRAWADDGESRVHRHYASAYEGVQDQLAFEYLWITAGWQLHDFRRLDAPKN